MVKVKCFDSLTRGRGKMGSYRVRPVRPVPDRNKEKGLGFDDHCSGILLDKNYELYE